MIIDTRDARRALSSTSRLSLGYLASIYDDTDPWKEDDEEDAKGLVFTEDIEKLKRYNAQDCVETARVWRGICSDQEWQTSRVQRLYAMHLELARLAAEMHTTGIAVDEETRQSLSNTLDNEHREGVAAFRGLCGLRDEHPVNSNTLRALLFARCKSDGIPNYALPDPLDRKLYTDEGEIKVDKKALMQIRIDPTVPDEVKKLIDVYQTAMRPAKAKSTFIAGNKVAEAIGPDGRLRPSWNTCGTDTGRWSCSSPNVMQVPQQLRAMYVAGPGRVFVHADKSQLEVRVMAAVSGDTTMEAHLNQADFYTEIAKEFFNLPASITRKTVKEEARKASKAIQLGSQYGAGDATGWQLALAVDQTMSFKMFSLLKRKWLKMYAQTTKYWESEMATVLAAGYSETRISGRRCNYPAEPELSEVVNYPIQGTAGDMMNLEIIELWHRLAVEIPDAKIVFQLHDAVDVECKEDDASKVKALILDCMQPSYTINGRVWNFPLDIKIGYRWSDV